jgi:hypothetical protein
MLSRVGGTLGIQSLGKGFRSKTGSLLVERGIRSCSKGNGDAERN